VLAGASEGLSSSSENPQAAVDVLERIEQSTSLLADHPDHGQSVGMIDNRYFVAIIDNMNAELLYRF
jgi:plasmid stabilization system protein ParE